MCYPKCNPPLRTETHSHKWQVEASPRICRQPLPPRQFDDPPFHNVCFRLLRYRRQNRDGVREQAKPLLSTMSRNELDFMWGVSLKFLGTVTRKHDQIPNENSQPAIRTGANNAAARVDGCIEMIQYQVEICNIGPVPMAVNKADFYFPRQRQQSGWQPRY